MAKLKPTTITEALPDRAVRRLVVLITEAASADALTAAGKAEGLTAAETAAAIEEARRRITTAAAFVRDVQVGIAFERLTRLYRRARRERDTRAALAAQREINKLVGLYARPEGEASDAEDQAAQLADAAAARAQLAPLKLAGPDAPLFELARLAVAKILALQAAAS